MKRAGRMIFLLSFAFLQCVAPLAHAHVAGDAAPGGRFHIFHFHDASQQHDQASRVSSAGDASKASDLPVVKVPDGKRRSHVTIVVYSPVLDRGGMVLPASRTPRKPVCAYRERVHLPSPFFRQYSQAPPACA